MNVRWTLLVLTLGTPLAATPAAAQVSAMQAAMLGGELTPLGAVRAGNEAGTIPAWEGGMMAPPAGYMPGMHHPDPFADDQPLFTITADNVDQYTANLSPGQVAMFRRYPETFRMPVYPSRRTAALPQRIYDRTIANATTATLVEGGNGVANAGEGIPFPIPQSGLEAIWNHLLRYRGLTLHRTYAQMAPMPDGAFLAVTLEEDALWVYQQPGATTETIDNKLVYFRQAITAPPRLAGTVLAVHETLNQVAEPRRAWAYNPGQQRVFEAPNVAYDAPGTASDGQRTADQLDMFNGAPDLYEWSLVGKQELYIPYNSYRLASDAVGFADILQPGHINPDLTRYELHRVWIVEARLREEASHIYARRTFYLDEDTWQAAIIDHYDGRGEMWRVSEAHALNFYEVPLTLMTAMTVYDLQNGRYLVNGLTNEYPPVIFDEPMDAADFTPEALAQLGGGG